MRKLKNLLILVNQDPAITQDRRIGHIFIPETVNSVDKQRTGTVVAVGDGTPEVPMELKVGDRIIYLNDEGRITVDDNILMRLNDVLFVLED